MQTQHHYQSPKEIAALRAFIKSFDDTYEVYLAATQELSEIERVYKKSYLACRDAYEECALYAELVVDGGGAIDKELKEPKSPLLDFAPLQLHAQTQPEGFVNEDTDDEMKSGNEGFSSDEQSGRQRRRGVRHKLKDYIRDSGYFLSSNQILEIVEGEYGATPSSTVTGGLSELTKDEVLKRFPSSEGFLYGLPEWFDEHNQPIGSFFKSVNRESNEGLFQPEEQY